MACPIQILLETRHSTGCAWKISTAPPLRKFRPRRSRGGVREKRLGAAREDGASHANSTLLRRPHQVAGLFREWLEWLAPEKAARVMSVLYDLRGQRANDPNFGSRMTGLDHFAKLIRQRFELACRRLGLSESLLALDTSQFIRSARIARNGQLDLF